MTAQVSHIQSYSTSLHGLRSSTRPNIRITQRDLEIVSLVADHQYLSTEQICSLRFPSLHRARKRLNRLWRYRLLNRTIIPVGLVGIAPQAIYSVATRGIRLLQIHGAPTPHGRRAKPLIRPGSLLFLSHTLNRNSFRIALEKAVSRLPSVSVADWKNDQTNKIPVKIPVAGDPGQLACQSIRPDASFCLISDGHGFKCHLEIDNGTTALSRIAAKSIAYHRLRVNQIANQSSGLLPERVLFVVFSEKRRQNIVSRLLTLARERAVSDLWLITVLNQARLLHTDILKDLQWWMPTRTGLRINSLADEMGVGVSRQNAA